MTKLHGIATLFYILLCTPATPLDASNARTRLQRIIKQIDHHSEMEKRDLKWKIAWIYRAHKDETHPLSATLAYRWESDELTLIGDIADLTDRDLVNVRLGNFVSTEYITQTRTRLSNDDDVYVGAIIIGTQDEKFLAELQRLLIKSKI